MSFKKFQSVGGKPVLINLSNVTEVRPNHNGRACFYFVNDDGDGSSEIEVSMSIEDVENELLGK